MINSETNLFKISLHLAVVVVLLILFSGCGIITETQCRYADFAEIGYADANVGKLRNHFSSYHEKCLSYDIDIRDELVMYDYGRERGLLNYCNNVRYNIQCDRGADDVRARTSVEARIELKRLESDIPGVSP